ncbi:MAG: hypothetical protein ACXQS5_06060 [Candidatus Methanospirareceae archaeon]
MGQEEREGMRVRKIVKIVAAITVVITVMFVLFSSTASAHFYNRTWTPTGGTFNYSEGISVSGSTPGADDESNAGHVVLLVYNWKSGDETGGEKIEFFNLSKNDFAPVTVKGPYTKSGSQYSGYDLEVDQVAAGDVWDAEGKKSDGYYLVEDETGNGGWLQVVKQTFDLELKKKKVQEGRSFNLTMKSNGRKEGVMKLTIEDSDGYSIMNADGKDIYKILLTYTEKNNLVGFADGQESVRGINFTPNNKLIFNTSELDMDAGKYSIILEDYATDAEEKADITVEEKYLKVECPDEVVKGKDMVIIIKSSFYEGKANITVEGMPDYEDKQLTLDEEGKKKVKIPTEDLDYGTYKVTVKVCGYDMKENKYVKIKKSGASLEVPEDATVGDIVHIKGSSDFGDFAVFLVDDVFKKEAQISDNKFDWDWDTGTSGELDGYREIEVFILNEHAPFSLGAQVSDDWQRQKGVDASATIFLFLPTFSMTVAEDIAEGDDVVISGSAIGTDHVYVIVINHKGEVMFPPGGTAGVINARTTPVEGGKWEENIGELDSGRYTVIALSEGRDGVTDAIKNGKWVAGDESKTLEQRVAIIEDKLSSAGSDDQFEKADFFVSAPWVTLEVPGTVEISNEIMVKAGTNIKTGEKAFFSLSQNASVLKKAFTSVENGSVQANINTSGLQPGRYNVAVYISGRASDEKAVILVEKKEVKEEGSKESIPQNESVTEPEAGVEANESMSGVNESQKEEEQKIPVNMWDVLIALVMATFVSVGMKRRCR